MPFRKLIPATVVHDAWHVLKGLLVAAFATKPLFVFTLALLFGLEVLLGTLIAREKGAPIRYRDYARAKYYELVKLGSWLAVVLLVTNLDPDLLHVQRYVLILTAVGLGGRIVKRHLGGQYSRMWVEVEGKVLHNASRKIETAPGKPDLLEQTIVSEVPQEPAAPTPVPPEAAFVIVAVISALLLAACAAPFLAF